MKSKLDLKEKLTLTIQIILDAKELMNDSYKMLMVDSSEKFSLIKRNKFLNRVRTSFWKLAIIELTKLYGSSMDHFRLDELINEMIVNYCSAEWATNISTDELKILQDYLNSDEIKVRTEKLRNMRNQHYAHTDKAPKNNIHDIKFYFLDFAFLLRNAELIVEELMSKIFDSQKIFLPYEGEDVDMFLNSYIELRKLKALSKLK